MSSAYRIPSHARWSLPLFALLAGGALAASGCSTTTSTSAAPVGTADGADAGASAAASDEGSTSASERTCTAGAPSGFAAKPTAIELPAARCGEAFDAMSGNGKLGYTMLDVNADHRPDLVVTKDACDADVGTKRWDVYLGAASGFAKTPAPFAIPAARCEGTFDATAGSGKVSYTLLDVNADRRPDLVVTKDECDEDLGTKRWDVYLASDEGFAKTPAPFALPAARCSASFDAVAGTGQLRYTLLDVDGDRRSDLVVTSDGCDADVGTKRWDVYAASDTGFAETPSAFALPAGRCDAKFDQVAGYAGVTYTLLDVNADHRPDLVVTRDGCDADVGAKRWDVYFGSASGFAKAPSPFTLPAKRCSTGFDATAGSGSVQYALVDLSCDGRGDLVVTADTCDADVGAKRWDVYLATDAGFVTSPAAVKLPAARCGVRFDAFSKRGAVPYGVIDLGGESRGDLLVTSDSCDEDVGKSHWDAYALE